MSLQIILFLIIAFLFPLFRSCLLACKQSLKTLSPQAIMGWLRTVALTPYFFSVCEVKRLFQFFVKNYAVTLNQVYKTIHL